MYIDLLNRIKNAQMAGLDKIKAPFSNMDMAVCEILVANKFIRSFEKKGRLPKRYLEVVLENKDAKRGGIHGLRLISKPSRKTYAGYRELRPVKQGFGIAVVTTPSGLMTNLEAKKKRVGGKILFEIW